MKRRNLDSLSGEGAAPNTDVVPINLDQELISPPAVRGLSLRVRQISKRNHGILRWIALAVVAGGVVALAFVQLAVR
jgi:hypothetical protein